MSAPRSRGGNTGPTTLVSVCSCSPRSPRRFSTSWWSPRAGVSPFALRPYRTMTHAVGSEQAFAELVLEGDQRGDGGSSDANGDLYSLPDILSAVRRVCLSRAAVPVLCGSSLRGIGVEPLLDSVSTFLPSPLDRPRPTGVVREPASRSGGGGGGKKRRRGEGAGVRATGGAGAAGTEAEGAVFEVDPLQDDLVAFVFKVRWSESGYLCSSSAVLGGWGGKAGL